MALLEEVEPEVMVEVGSSRRRLRYLDKGAGFSSAALRRLRISGGVGALIVNSGLG